jgi:fluoroacetyl-CoA thioesterase
MKATLQPGLRFERELETKPEMGVGHLGPENRLLSTPSLIGMMEGVCLNGVQEHLDEGETTVGYHVDVYHRNALRVGQKVRIVATLESIEGRRLHFAVEAYSVDGTKIGDGHHTRVVINPSRYSQR